MKYKRKYLYLLFLLLTALAVITVVGSDEFLIEKITILGNSEFMYNDIVKVSGIMVGQNIFKLDKELAYRRIESNPYLEVISITREFPDEVIVTVRERSAVAAVEYLASYIIIDTEGIALEIIDAKVDSGYISIKGLYTLGFILGEELMVEDAFRLESLKRLLREVYIQEVQNEIIWIDMENPNDIHMISNAGLKVRVGQAVDVDKKLRWLRTEQFKTIENSNMPGELDLSVPTQAVFHPLQN